MLEPEWLDLDLILEIHGLILRRYGGAPGLRDLGLLQSALARPLQLHKFDSSADLHSLAASYANGISERVYFPSVQRLVLNSDGA